MGRNRLFTEKNVYISLILFCSDQNRLYRLTNLEYSYSKTIFSDTVTYNAKLLIACQICGPAYIVALFNMIPYFSKFKSYYTWRHFLKGQGRISDKYFTLKTITNSFIIAIRRIPFLQFKKAIFTVSNCIVNDILNFHSYI